MSKTNYRTAAVMPQASIDDAKKSMASVAAYLNAEFSEREEVIELLLTAAVGMEHMVMVGAPGTGKSAIARAFASCLGGSYYEYLFTAFSVPEEFVGPFSLKGLDNDEYRRILDGRFCDADVVFADEIFKSNSASLNTLLPILNERIVHNGGAATKVPLRICVAASNEMPQGDELGALWDRLLLRAIVEPLRGNAARRALLERDLKPRAVLTPPSMHLDALNRLSAAIGTVRVSGDTIEALLNLRAELEAEGIVYGDRRWVKALKLMRANALVLGDDEADTHHMRVLKAALWNKPEQRETVAAKVNRLSAPETQKAIALHDAFMEEMKKLEARGKVDDLGGAVSAATETFKKLKSLQSDVGTTTRAGVEIGRLMATVSDNHTRLREFISTKFLGSGLS